MINLQTQTDWGTVKQSNIENKQEILEIITILSSAFATSYSYEFTNVTLSNLSSELVTTIAECDLYFQYESIVKGIKCYGNIDFYHGEYGIYLSVDREELSNLNVLTDSTLYEIFNNLSTVNDAKYKILLNGERLYLKLYILNQSDKYANISTLRNYLNDCIYNLDEVLHELDSLYEPDSWIQNTYSSVIHPLLIFKDYDTFNISKIGIYDMTYVKQPTLGKTILSLPDKNKIHIEVVHDNDKLLNISSNMVTMLHSVDEVEYDESTKFYIYMKGISEKIYLELKDPKYVGINGVYTEEPVQEIIIGTIDNSTIIPVNKDKQEYENMCFVHILDDNYENRKFVMQL